MNWKEEWDKKFKWWEHEYTNYPNESTVETIAYYDNLEKDMVIDFIQSILDQQKREIVEKLNKYDILWCRGEDTESYHKDITEIINNLK